MFAATVDLLSGFDSPDSHQILLEEFQDKSLGYLEGYKTGCRSFITDHPPKVIYQVLEVIHPQVSMERARYIWGKLKVYCQNIPDTINPFTFNIDINAPTTTDKTTPEFIHGVDKGKLAIATIYQRFLDYFEQDYKTGSYPNPPHTEAYYKAINV